MSGCPFCAWSGEIAETHDRSHSYATHVIVKGGEMFVGRTCSRRTRPRRSSFSYAVSLIRNSLYRGPDQ